MIRVQTHDDIKRKARHAFKLRWKAAAYIVNSDLPDQVADRLARVVIDEARRTRALGSFGPTALDALADLLRAADEAAIDEAMDP